MGSTEEGEIEEVDSSGIIRLIMVIVVTERMQGEGKKGTE